MLEDDIIPLGEVGIDKIKNAYHIISSE